mgnify:CR=1 FL=1
MAIYMAYILPIYRIYTAYYWYFTWVNLGRSAIMCGLCMDLHDALIQDGSNCS